MVLVAPTTRVAHADDDGLAITSSTTYTVQPDDGIVHVVADVRLRNTTSSEWVNGRLRTYYFTGFSWPMPTGARNTVATSGSRRLGVDTVDVPDSDAFFYVDITFTNDLTQGERTNVHLEYDIVGLPPRSAGYSRVNPAYAGFDAYGAGDPGQMSVSIVFPAGWDAEVLGGDTEQSTKGDSLVVTVTSIWDEQYGFSLFVSGRRDDTLDSTTVALGAGTGAEGTTVEVRSWPGDDEWTEFVVGQLDRGLPALVDAIGRPWVEDDGFVIREAYTPYLYGYAGWYNGDDAEIEIGEDLDAETVLHELSHAWFNDLWFADRWITEGLAQEYSNAVLAQLGDESFAPEDVDPDDEWALALEEWGEPDFVNGADGYEDFGYAASYHVIDELVTEVGDDAMRDIFATADERLISYVGDGAAEQVSGLRDWRMFLDLLENLGGSTSAEDVFRTWVLTGDQAATLDDRAAARDDYAALDERGGDWAPPLVVRVSMAHWNFGAAADQSDAANAALDERDRLAGFATALGLQLPASIESAFEDADSIAALERVTRDIDDLRPAVMAIGDATVAVGDASGPLAWIGLIGSDVRGDLQRARAAFEQGPAIAAQTLAASAAGRAGDATRIGLERLAAVLGALLVLGGIAGVLVRRRRAAPPDPDGPTGGQPPAPPTWVPTAPSPDAAPSLTSPSTMSPPEPPPSPPVSS